MVISGWLFHDLAALGRALLADAVDAVIGVDTHTDTHTAAVVSPLGICLPTSSTPCAAPGTQRQAVQLALGRRDTISTVVRTVFRYVISPLLTAPVARSSISAESSPSQDEHCHGPDHADLKGEAAIFPSSVG